MADKRPEDSPLEQGRRDTEIKRETDLRDSLGPVPGTDAEREPKVSPERDVFKDTPPQEPTGKK